MSVELTVYQFPILSAGRSSRNAIRLAQLQWLDPERNLRIVSKLLFRHFRSPKIGAKPHKNGIQHRIQPFPY